MSQQQLKSLIGQQELSTKTITYSTVLGRGAFAAVFRAKCDELPCAAKILHTIFQDDPGVESLKERFYQECEYLKNIKHPNIVQYLGLCREPATNQPVLLMELMDQSLTNFLESSTIPLSRGVQLRLCHDIALALAHLHSISIIHRDLSSNNVLLIGPGSRAKVSDFGMSKVRDTSIKSKYTTPLTMVPGTVAYMPQEALGENPKYTEKLDCFSFGVLAIQVMTRLFPDPLPRKKEVESTLSPSGTVLVAVVETECRKDHIDMIDKTNPLLDIAIECLALKMEDRPHACELCSRVEGLKGAKASTKDSNQLLVDTDSCTAGPEPPKAEQNWEERIVTLQQQLEDSERQNCELIAAKENLEKKLAMALQVPAVHSCGLTFGTWRCGAPAPEIVAKSSSAAVFNNSMCCSFKYIVCDYDIKSNKWKELPKLSAADFIGLHIVFHGELSKLIAVKNTTLYIVHDGEWVAQGSVGFSPWGILYYEKFVLLFGPEGEVLIMQFSNDAGYVRSTSRILPTFVYSSITICKGFVYLVGVNCKQIWSKQVYRLQLDNLLPSSAVPKSSWLDRSISKKKKGSWQEIASLPLARSTCVSFNDRLLAVGGFANNQACGDIFLYDEEQDKWDVIGRIPTPRYNCLAEVVCDQLVVVGGYLNHMTICDVVEVVNLNC